MSGYLVQGGVTPDDSVSTVKIQDDAVTLAKLAAGTDGNIISYDASGNPVAIATGSDGEVLTSAGAGQPPAFEAAGGGGAWSVLSSGTLSNVASFDITGITKTTKIMFSFTAVGGDLGGMNIWTSSDGGSSFDSGSANYYSAVWRHDEAKGSQVHGYAGATYLFAAASSALASAAGASMAGDITLIDPQNTSNYTHAHMDYSYNPTTTECNREVAMGFRASAGRVNAIRIDPTSNNISGSYVVYELN
jgi:hypothetical protein